MTQYIPKDALATKIDNILDYADEHWDTDLVIGAQRFANKLRDAIDTLEVKDVDIDKEIGKFFGEDDWKAGAFEEEQRDMIKFAKHFFELGLKTQKGE